MRTKIQQLGRVCAGGESRGALIGVFPTRMHPALPVESEGLMKTSKSAKVEKTVLKPTHNPRELVVVAGNVVSDGIPNAEGGPDAWAETPLLESLSCYHVLIVAILQLAKSPKFRGLSLLPMKQVIVITDVPLCANAKAGAILDSTPILRSCSEARRLADIPIWVQLPKYVPAAEIPDIVANEIGFLREQDENLEPSDVLILIWKSDRSSFNGVSEIEIGRKVCDAVFTLGTDWRPAFTNDDDDDDRRGEEWKRL